MQIGSNFNNTLSLPPGSLSATQHQELYVAFNCISSCRPLGMLDRLAILDLEGYVVNDVVPSVFSSPAPFAPLVLILSPHTCLPPGIPSLMSMRQEVTACCFVFSSNY